MVKVFVYGTLKKGFSLNYLLANSIFIGEASLNGYDMYSLTSFPFITKGKGKVYGEVYEVSEDLLKRLDMIEGGYVRKEVEVEILGKKMKVYTYVKDIDIKIKIYWNLNKIDCGVWI